MADLTSLPRLALRWASLHGTVRVLSGQAARAGDPQAMLIADPATRADPLGTYTRIREQGALVRTRVGRITVDHAVAFALLRSDDLAVTSVGVAAPAPLRAIERLTRGSALHPLQEPSLLSVEPPEHTRYRTLVSSVFTARAVAGLRDMVQATADRLLDELAADARAGRTVDLVERYCAQLPVAVISAILGVPESERQRVLRFGELAAPSLDIGLTWPQFRQVDAGLRGFDTWLGEHLASLRRNPGDDLLSQLVAAREDGVGLDDRELRATAGLVLAAGFETTVNLLGSGARMLVDHPDQLERLRADPALWPTAVEETLRLESPVQLTARMARRETEVAGHRLAAGEIVILVLAGANRDPQVFENPDTVDVGRRNANRHLAFSGGRHFCLGAALARQEGEVGLRTLFERFPDLAVAGPGTRRPTRVLRGWATLPVELGAPAPVPA
ncbi:cytochrome P450 [Rhodococcus aerolatus]